MYKKTIIVLLAFSGLFSFAQKTDCAAMKTQVDNQKVEIAELTKQNNYFRESLDLLKPLSTATENNLEISIVNAVGNKKDKSLTVYFIYKNLLPEDRSSFQPTKSFIVDDRGNQSQTYDVFAGSKIPRVENVKPNIPYKGNLQFKVEEVDFPMIKHLNLKFGYVGKKIGIVEEFVTFENIPVTWK